MSGRSASELARSMSPMTSSVGPDGRSRCNWVSAAPEFVEYHDNEWGFAVADDRQLFEKFCLESFQSGLSWRTILAKRENFRQAFAGFDFHVVAEFDGVEIDRLLGDAGIVRHRGKIEAVINNARRAVALVEDEGSLSSYVWRFEPPADEVVAPQSGAPAPSAIKLSKDLKARGFRFVGPTTVFAFMQAMGLVNDHATDCYVRPVVSARRQDFHVPG